MEASEKPQLPLESGDAGRRRPGDRRPPGDRAPRGRRRARPPASCGSRPRQEPPAGRDRHAGDRGRRSPDRVRGDRRQRGLRPGRARAPARPLADRLGGAIEEGQDEFAERIADSFDSERTGSVQQQIARCWIAAMEHQRTQLAKQFSAQDGANPLSDFKEAMVRTVKELAGAQQHEHAQDRERIEALTAEVTALRERYGATEECEAEEAGTPRRAGLRGAGPRGDRARSPTVARRRRTTRRRSPGETRGKKGDTVVEIGAARAAPAWPRSSSIPRTGGCPKTQGLGGAERLLDERGRGLRGPGRGRRGQRAGRPREARRVRGQQADRRRRSRGARAASCWSRLPARRGARKLRSRHRPAGRRRRRCGRRPRRRASTLKQAQAIRSTLTGIKTQLGQGSDGLDAMVEAVSAARLGGSTQLIARPVNATGPPTRAAAAGSRSGALGPTVTSPADLRAADARLVGALLQVDLEVSGAPGWIWPSMPSAGPWIAKVPAVGEVRDGEVDEAGAELVRRDRDLVRVDAHADLELGGRARIVGVARRPAAADREGGQTRDKQRARPIDRPGRLSADPS